MSAAADAVAPTSEFETGVMYDALLIGSLAFAGGGALLSLVICRLLRAALPELSRRIVMAIVAVGIPLLTVLTVGLIGLGVNGEFSLSFVFTMRREGWAFFLAAEVAGLMLARYLAPAPALRVDPATFE